jgi:hypothetical protein
VLSFHEPNKEEVKVKKAFKWALAACVVVALVSMAAACSSGNDLASTPAADDSTAQYAAPVDNASSGETTSQDNARRSAEGYLETSAFSRNGLIQQLSSAYGEGFSKADAIYAVDHITVDWNEQAAKAAEGYLETSTFSRQGLIEQLSSSYGDGFTYAQAVYGVSQTGL